MAVLISVGAILFLALIFILKNEVTFRQHMTVSLAIHAYIMDKITNRDYTFEVDYSDEEPYEKTLFRLWDWGYKNILPKDKFEIIKPYIEGEKE